MTSTAIVGPAGSLAWQAAKKYQPEAEIILFSQINSVVSAFVAGEVQWAIIPAYNTREGEIKEYFRAMERLSRGHWVDNIVLNLHLSLAGLDESSTPTILVGEAHCLKQSADFIAEHFADIGVMASQDIEQTIAEIKAEKLVDRLVIGPEDMLMAKGLVVRQREVAPHNRTRFAVLGNKRAEASGYDATAMITAPLKDRVGLLYDTLGEFSKRGINLLDLRSETDLKTQKMQFYIEAEGHCDDEAMRLALAKIEKQIICEPGAIKILGSFPRIDMRTKQAETFGFVGSGDMSKWFAARLEGEGYQTLITGRATALTPGEMIAQVDVVVICVPISATAETIRELGPLLKEGQALIILAGEAEDSLQTALECCPVGVEVMLVHNLWGPAAGTMKDKNATVVRTKRSGALCDEFESFLYKHGALISQDEAAQHDLLMGVGQKLPTVISTAMAMALEKNGIEPADIESHSTLTSLYGILAMCRIHSQNPRTYAEIMASKGAGRRIVRDFVAFLGQVMDLAEAEEIDKLCALLKANKSYLGKDFLQSRMEQALAVDDTLSKIMLK